MVTSDVDSIKVFKRDGKSFQKYDNTKIKKAILGAAKDIKFQFTDQQLEELINNIDNYCFKIKEIDENSTINVDTIQKIVKKVLMDSSFKEVAERYIVYSYERDMARKERLKPNPDSISEYIFRSRYARFLDDKKRRENWGEAIDRVMNMHIKKHPGFKDEIVDAFNFVREKRVLPSMRSMQFGGSAQEAHHQKGYNCSFSPCNRVDFFKEAFHQLLCGVGVGFSVQWHHIESLPSLSRVTDESSTVHFVIPDTIEGWSDSVGKLIESFIHGYNIEFAYNKIRARNTPLKVSGGKAPGYKPLKKALENIRVVLSNAQGRCLKPIECYDIVCMFADAVYSGGIREAALICLFSIEDGEMMNAKTGDWFSAYPWRARSNNSVIALRGTISQDQYRRIFGYTKQWGEPGFVFTDDLDYGTNPCSEISLHPKIVATHDEITKIKQWAKKFGKKIPSLKSNEVYWGWQFCNLTEINVAACKSDADFYACCRAASIIGTLQASFFDFNYLSWVSEYLTFREGLLGVSLTGIMDNPDIGLNPLILRNGAEIVVNTNIDLAGRIGINPAARTNCIKPSGTASLVLGSVGSGIHPHHARRYFRRVRATPGNPIYEFFKSKNPHMCKRINSNKDIITFTVNAPDAAVVRKNVSAIEFLDKVMIVMNNWVIPGTANTTWSPKAFHNVSNTITVKDNEWNAVMEYLWNNNKYFMGVSMLGDFGDKVYDNAPREEVVSESDEAAWNQIIRYYTPVNFDECVENTDETNLQGEAACAGGKCDILKT